MQKVRKIILLIIVMLCTTTNVQAFTIVLDPGHGGVDSGAVSGSLYESNVTLKIAKFLKQYLEQYENVSVSLTHEGIESGELTVFDRAISAREKNADLFVSLHINSSTSSKVNGAEIYVTANTSLEKYNKNTTELANAILENLNKLGISNRGVLTKQLTTDTTDKYSDGTMADYYGIIRYAMRGTKIDYGETWPEGKQSANIQNGEGVPTILVEHCFISSSVDRAYIDSDEDIKQLAKADADAIVEYYNLQKKNENVSSIKIDEDSKTIKIAPKTTVEELVKQLNIANYSIVDKDGKKLEKSNEKIATGYKINILNSDNKTINKTYTLVKLGDVNGDGKVLALDALAIVKHSINSKKIEGIYLEAADVNKDGKILATDALAIVKHSIGSYTITI